MHGGDLRHTTARGWFVWDGTRWAADETGEAVRRAKHAVESLWAEASGNESAAKHAWKSQGSGPINSCLSLASTEPTVALKAKAFDAHPGLLNPANGKAKKLSATRT